MSDIGLFAGAIILLETFAMFLLFILVERQQRLLDRYRLKYSFDLEIESKEVGGKDEYAKEERLKKREKFWRRRVYKD